ncbi:MAG TPA: TonB family protein [Ohtaekwangia sp.]|nr:TonB family protein [Ohtaekwangia sp.]
MADVFQNIEKYKRGELSPAEMHALEKKALSDPFLADALEGANDIPAEDFSFDLETLKHQLNERTAPTVKVVSIWGWSVRIAAAIAFIVVTTFVIRELAFNDNTDNGNLALNENNEPYTAEQSDTVQVKPKASETIEEPSSSITALPESSSTDNQKQPPPTGGAGEVSVEKNSRQEIEVVPEIATEAPASIPFQNEDKAFHRESETIASAPEQADQSFDLRKKRKAIEEFAALKTVKGQVKDTEGRALPGVNVTIDGTNTGTITDEEGKYEISMEDLNKGLMFSFIGYEDREVVPGVVNEVNVELEEDVSQLSEVVVVGYGTKRESDIMDAYPTVEMAIPEGGRKAYKKYLENNLNYPEQALNNKVEGKVTVQFTIGPSGEMSEFQILKGLGYGCDEEVIRLIKTGPKWSATKKDTEPIRDRVKVRLKFKLPKK